MKNEITPISKESSDFWKGVAILLVVLHHFFHDPVQLVPSYLFIGLGPIACSIFYFLSGYGLGLSGKYLQGGHYWKYRIKKLLVPGFVANILLVIYSFIFRKYSVTPFTFLDIIGVSNLNHPIWFLQVLILMYTALYASVKFRINRYFLTLSIGLLYIFLTNSFGVMSFISFPLGLLIAEKHKGLSTGLIYTMITICFSFLVMYSMNNAMINTVNKMAVFLIMIISSVAFAFLPSIPQKRIKNAIQVVGRNSIYLYLTHAMAIYISIDVCGTNSWSAVWICIIASAVLVIFSKGITLFIINE